MRLSFVLEYARMNPYKKQYQTNEVAFLFSDTCHTNFTFYLHTQKSL